MTKKHRTTIKLSKDAYDKLKEHQQKTYRGTIINSIEWLVLTYADYDIEQTLSNLDEKNGT